MRIEKNISLKDLTTFKVGGNADYFCKVSSIDELKETVLFAKDNNLEIFVLGGGSNVLISDNGFRGFVIKIEIKGILFQDDKIIADAGENWDDVVKLSVKNNLYGIENMSYIPGTVGGGVVGNIGAYGSVIKDVVEYVEVFDVKKLKIFILNKNECEFDYRNSVFKKNKNYIITKVCLKLSKDKKPNLSYGDVKKYFNYRMPKIEEIRVAIREIRNKKFPDLNKYGNAGSFFKNPIINGEKIYLAKILDEMGLKGYKENGVLLYERQPLVVINSEAVNADKIKNFTDNIARKVFEKRKIKIFPEVVFIGEFKNYKINNS